MYLSTRVRERELLFGIVIMGGGLMEEGNAVQLPITDHVTSVYYKTLYAFVKWDWNGVTSGMIAWL